MSSPAPANNRHRLKPNAGIEPETRLKWITDKASSVTVDPKRKATTYLRTGRVMYSSAKNYLDAGSVENGYILYVRFVTIFLDQIRSHPGYMETDPEERKLIKSYCRELIPGVEALKKTLLEQYRLEYEDYRVEYKKMQDKIQEEEERMRREREEAQERAHLEVELLLSKF